MYDIGIMTAGDGTLPLGLVNSQETHPDMAVRAIVYAPYHKLTHYRVLRGDLIQQTNEMGIPLFSIPRPYEWKRTSMEVPMYKKIKYEKQVFKLFDMMGVNLVFLDKWDQLVTPYLLGEYPMTVSTHPDDPDRRGGVGMDHYTVLEDVLRSRDRKIYPTIVKVEPKKKVDAGEPLLQSGVDIPKSLHKMFKENPTRAVGILDELDDSEFIKMVLQAIEKMFD